MRPIFPSRRCLPPEKPAGRALLRGFVRRVRRHHWPVVAAAARVHRGSKTSTRPGYRAPLSRAFRGPHALPRLLQMFCFHEHDHGPLEHPRPPNPWFGTIASSTERNLSIEGDRRRYAGPGVEKEPNLDIPHRDCSRRRLRPNPDRSGHLLSRAPLFALSGKTGADNGIADVAPACTAGTTRGSCDA